MDLLRGLEEFQKQSSKLSDLGAWLDFQFREKDFLPQILGHDSHKEWESSLSVEARQVISAGVKNKQEAAAALVPVLLSWKPMALLGYFIYPWEERDKMFRSVRRLFVVDLEDFVIQHPLKFGLRELLVVGSLARNMTFAAFSQAVCIDVGRRYLADKPADNSAGGHRTLLSRVHFESIQSWCKALIRGDWISNPMQGFKRPHGRLSATTADKSNEKHAEKLKRMWARPEIAGVVQSENESVGLGLRLMGKKIMFYASTLQVGIHDMTAEEIAQAQAQAPAIAAALPVPASAPAEDAFDNDDDQPSVASGEPAINEEDAVLADLVSSMTETKPFPQELVGRSRCKCKDVGVSEAMRDVHEINRKDLLLFWGGITQRWPELREACYNCILSLAGRAGFQTRQFNREKLGKLFEECIRRFERSGVNGILALKEGKFHLIFRRGEKPDNDDLKHGVKRFYQKEIALEPDLISRDTMLAYLSRGQAEEFLALYEEKGTILVNPDIDAESDDIADVFQHPSMAWMLVPFDRLGVDMDFGEMGCLRDLCEEEARLYLYHQKADNNHSNYGWNRMQYYSIGQMIAKADPSHYVASVALRNDWQNTPHLVSWPYYVRYAHAEEKSEFYHLDLSPEAAIKEGKFLNTVQSSISMSDETSDCCVLLVNGFHKRFPEWWADCVAQGLAKEEFPCFRVDNKVYSKKMQDKYGGFEALPLKKGTMRFSKPEIIHGSNGNLQGKKAMMPGVVATKLVSPRLNYLPWMCRVDLDAGELEYGHHKHLTYNELRRCAIDCTVPPWTLGNVSGEKYTKAPGGVTNLSTVPPTAFGKAVTLHSPWSDPEALETLEILLGPDLEAMKREVERERRETLAWAVKRFDKLRKLEKKTYEEESFFRKVDAGETIVYPAAIPPDTLIQGISDETNLDEAGDDSDE